MKSLNLKQKIKKDIGFSLFEVIIYVAILSGLMVASSNMFISLSKGNGQSQAKNEVNSVIRFATELLKQDLKNASVISTPSTITPTSSSLTLTRGGVSIVYDVSGGTLRRTENGTTTNVTNTSISVGTPTFTRTENYNSIFNITSVSINATMVFSYNSTSPDWSYSASLDTSVDLTADGILSFVGTYVAPTTTVPTITSPTSTSLTQTTATLGANVTDLGLPASISARGVCYGTSPNPTIPCVAEGSTTTGVFTKGVTGLTAGTTYYFRGYATNTTGTGYSADSSFTTTAGNSVPTVTSPTSTSVAGTTATLGANVTSLGVPASISARGTCWGTSASPTTNCVAESGTTTGVFTQARTGFTAGTIYYYRGYATNNTGTAYSADDTFTTLIIPIVTTPTSTSVASTTATLGANVTSLGIPASITARGVCYATTSNPTTPCVAEGSTTTGVFTKGVTGLTAGTTYYYRGYATNATGTAYSPDGTFTTTSTCGGTSYNGYCWYNNPTQNQICGTYCTGIGKTCINSNQTCAQDMAVFNLFGYGCGTTYYDSNQNFSAPATNSNICAPRTSVQYNCGPDPVVTSTCTSVRQYWYPICSCSS